MAHPSAILTLRLSSPSFLETILTDNGVPVYSTETNTNTTTLSRCDPYRGLTTVAHIHWPENRSSKGKGKSSSTGEAASARVAMDGTLLSEDDLLKRNCFNTSRKFRIPGHSDSLKWRRVQGLFQCVSSHGTPIAIFEPAVYTSTARISVFVPTLNGLPQAQGCVSQILLDYLIVTALLLLTHPEDWRGFMASVSSPALVAPVGGGGHVSMPRASPPPLPALQTTPPASPLTPSPFSPAEPHYLPFQPYTPYLLHHPPLQQQQQQPQQQQRRPRSLPHARSHAHLSSSSDRSSVLSAPTFVPRVPSHPSLSSGSTGSSSHTSEKQHRLAVVNYDDEPRQVSYAHARSPRVIVQSPQQLTQEYHLQTGMGEIHPGEAPPPYEEIAWTVRVRQPRRRTQTQV